MDAGAGADDSAPAAVMHETPATTQIASVLIASLLIKPHRSGMQNVSNPHYGTIEPADRSNAEVAGELRPRRRHRTIFKLPSTNGRAPRERSADRQLRRCAVA